MINENKAENWPILQIAADKTRSFGLMHCPALRISEFLIFNKFNESVFTIHSFHSSGTRKVLEPPSSDHVYMRKRCFIFVLQYFK